MRNPFMNLCLLALPATALGLPLPAIAQPADEKTQPGDQAQVSSSARHTLSGAAYHSRGDYGQDADTSIHYFPLSYEYATTHWRIKATVPHLRISGFGDVLVNVGGVGRNDVDSLASSERVSASGPGDAILAVTYQFDSFFDGGPFLDVTVDVKLATADEDKGLGTGEHDFGAQVDLYQMLGDSTLFATAGYRQRGRTPLFEDLQDSFFLSLGMMRPWANSWLERQLGGQWSYGMIYDYREAASAFSRETHELMPFLSWNPSSQWTVMQYLAKGFTDDSADIAVGAQFSYRW